MNLAENGIIRKLSLGKAARRFVAIFTRPPSCERPFKISRQLLQMLAISFLIPNAAERIHSAVAILTMKRRMCVFTEDSIMHRIL